MAIEQIYHAERTSQLMLQQLHKKMDRMLEGELIEIKKEIEKLKSKPVKNK